MNMKCPRCGSYITVVKLEDGCEIERCKDCNLIKRIKDLREKPILHKYRCLDLRPAPTSWCATSVGRLND